MIARPLLERVPEVAFDWVELARLPTPVDRARFEGLGELFVKRDDLTSPLYGGNKVRTLEVLFGRARARGAARVFATGAFGSNHAAATVLHAPRAGLEPGVILFPQPASRAAVANLRVVLARRPRAIALPHWSTLPLGMAWARASRPRADVMLPGGADEDGALGYVSAALELAEQVERGELPAPARVVVGVGSTCTSAGLLVGLRMAASLGLGWRRPPALVSVRVTPWPVTSRLRIVGLAARVAARLSARAGRPDLAFRRSSLSSGLEVDPRELGRGYGWPTRAGRTAIDRFRREAGFELDTTYSAKAAAAALRRLDGRPTLFWSTKSTAPLPEADDWPGAPRAMRRWLERAARAPV